MISFLFSEQGKHCSCWALWQVFKGRCVEHSWSLSDRKENPRKHAYKDYIYNTQWIDNCLPGGNYRWKSKSNAQPICCAGLLRRLAGVESDPVSVLLREELLHGLNKSAVSDTRARKMHCINLHWNRIQYNLNFSLLNLVAQFWPWRPHTLFNHSKKQT